MKKKSPQFSNSGFIGADTTSLALPCKYKDDAKLFVPLSPLL